MVVKYMYDARMMRAGLKYLEDTSASIPFGDLRWRSSEARVVSFSLFPLRVFGFVVL